MGFGTGGFKRHGGIQQLDYILPPMGKYEEEIVIFSYVNVTKELTFDWFKANVLCVDQEWICEMWPARQKLQLHLKNKEELLAVSGPS